MKLTRDLIVSGYQIKEVGEPTESTDAVNKEFFDKRIASWQGTRYYYVHKTLGSDDNIGYSNINEKLAFLRPVRSVERLCEIIPRIGSGASISIAIGSGVYDNLKLSLIDYEEVSICGIGPSRILGKYNCLSTSRDNNKIKIANFDGSDAYIQNFNFNACRARFDEHTITSSLRNKTIDIYEFTANFTSMILLKEQLPVTPCAEDIIIIEEPGVVINSFEVNVFAFKPIKLYNILGSKKFQINSPLSKPDITFCYGPDIL